MNHPMIAMLAGPEIVVILLILLMVAGLAVGLVLLVIWVAQRQGVGQSDARESRPVRKLSFVEVSNGKPRLRWGVYLLGLGLVLVGMSLLNGLLLAAGVWSGVDTVLIGLVVGVVIFNILVFLEFNRASGTGSPGDPTPPVAPSPTAASPAVDPASCPRCGAPLPPNAPQGLCPKCVLGVGLATQTEADPDEHGPHGTKIVPPAEAEVARRFPQFEILECLGHGGMGVVYKARQPKLNRLVALKILAPEKAADPKFAERFEREAQALARLSHPNIVAVHDYGEADGMFYLLMEYVDGSTLRQLLRAGRLKPESALAIVPSICEALQFAHQQGVVHRDIKPENVLLDLSGRVKIADFGIAKLVDVNAPRPALTEERSVIGTPHYMAPEQVEHPQLVDHRADIYSLGVVFYEMLTGELPLGKFQPPSRKVELDVRLDEVVLHALEKEPARRYQHASEVKTDVETIRTSATPIRRPDHVGRCRIPGTQFALVISRAGQRRVEWNHVGLAGLLLILAGACGLGMVALVAHLSGFNIEPRSYQAAGVGLAFVAAMILTIVVRSALRMTEEEFARPDRRAITVVNETTDPAHIEMARQRVQWPATGLLAIGLCFPVVLGCFVYFGYWPGNWQGAFALGCALTLGYTIILGSHRMRQLKTYRVAVLGAITGLLVTFPALPLAAFPIWALMVLHRPDVRAAFNDPRKPGTAPER
jgi:tRNA A-37 threonylcarbamoyl transferase component Bud32